MACAAYGPISPIQRREWIQCCNSVLVPKFNPTCAQKHSMSTRNGKRNKQEKMEAELCGPIQSFYMWMYEDVSRKGQFF